MPLRNVARFERFFRVVASLDVDKSDLKRYGDLSNQKLYDLLLRAEAVARANNRDVIQPFDLPITKGLDECITVFKSLDENIALKPILDALSVRPPLGLPYSEETEARLPEILGGLGVAIARAFKILDPELKTPKTLHWDRVTEMLNLLA